MPYLHGFKKTNVEAFPRVAEAPSDEELFWKGLQHPVTIKDNGAIQAVNFSPVEPHYLAVSASAKVQLIDPTANQVVKTFSKFKEAAFGAKFRHDGQVIFCGGDEGFVRMFDVERKALLRIFKGHENAIRRVELLEDGSKVISYSDDKTVKLWDVPTQELLATYSEHSDMVRAGAVNPTSPALIISGSYDHTVKLTDTRVGDCVITMDTGFPVEDAAFFPSGACVVTAGGNSVQVWDLLAGGKRVVKHQNHHKAVTCLAFTSDYSQFLSGSIDRHVKIYSAKTLTLAHSLDYPSAILSLAVSPDDKVLAVGSVDGYLSLRARLAKVETLEERFQRVEEKRLLSARRAKSVAEARTKAPVSVPKKVDERVREKRLELGLSSTDVLVRANDGTFAAPYDESLVKCNFSEALASAFDNRKNPEVLVSVFRELIRRGALKKALGGKKEGMYFELLSFVTKYLMDRRYASVLIDVAHDFIDAYCEGTIPNSRRLEGKMKVLRNTLESFGRFWEAVSEVSGAVDMILAVKRMGEAEVKGVQSVDVVDLVDDDDGEGEGAEDAVMKEDVGITDRKERERRRFEEEQAKKRVAPPVVAETPKQNLRTPGRGGGSAKTKTKTEEAKSASRGTETSETKTGKRRHASRPTADAVAADLNFAVHLE